MKNVSGAVFFIELLISLLVVTLFSAACALSCWYTTLMHTEIAQQTRALSYAHNAYAANSELETTSDGITITHVFHVINPAITIHDPTIMLTDMPDQGTVCTTTAQWKNLWGKTGKVSLISYRWT